jgi:hypothetical protein
VSKDERRCQTGRNVRAAWCSATAALLLSLSAVADTSASAPRPNAANGIILTAKQARVCLGDRMNYVTPSESDVRRLESSLARALAGVAANDKNGWLAAMATQVLERMAKDVRFYVGTADGFIYVYGYCADIIEHTGRACPPRVSDGGSCIWYIRFDVTRGTLDRFRTNGEA